MSRRDDEDVEYEVGYGRPPRSTRFRKGQSGNPKGRPKAAKGVSASLKRELDTKIKVREGRREFEVSKAEAIAKRLVALGLSGDIRALTWLARFEQALADSDGAGAGGAADDEVVDEVDFAILRQHFSTAEGPEDAGTVDEATGGETADE